MASRSGSSWPLAAGLLTLVACLTSLSPSPHWLDCGELVAATATLGIPHPPGHPVVVLLGAAAGMLPLGSFSFRVALASAAALALAAGLLALLGRRLLCDAFALAPRVAAPVAAAAALAAAWSGPALLQGVRAEVYAANALLTLAALLALAGPPSPRRLACAGLLAGLGLANHHYLVVLALVGPGLVVLVTRPRPTPNALAAAGVGCCVGLSSYLLLPVRALADPLVAWGDPRQLDRLLWTASARTFARSVESAGSRSLSDNLLHTLFMLWDGLGPVAGLAGLVGLGVLARRHPRLGGLLLLALLGTLLSKALMDFDPHNPDLHGYLLGGTLLLALGCAALAALALEAASTCSRPLRIGLAALVALLLVVWPATRLRTGGPGVPADDFDDARVAASAALSSVPVHGVALSADFNLIFALWAARATGGARPDVALVHRPFLAFPGFADAVARRDPELAAWARREWRGAVDRARCLAPAPRPLRAEPYHDLPPACLARLRADGLFARLAAPDAPAAPLPGAFWGALQRRLHLGDPQTQRWLVWNHWLQGRQRVAAGDVPGARAHLAEARRWAPGSPDLAALGRDIDVLARRAGQ